MNNQGVLRQRNWSDAELKALDFRLYETRKRVVMARTLTQAEGPKVIDQSKENLVANVGDVICYNAGQIALASINDYDQWPVRVDLFLQNYKRWDVSGWKPNPAESHLMEHGCKPYYKAASVWAKRISKSVHIQSLESPQPVSALAGRWLCIGANGEPYHMSDEKFRNHYLVPSMNLAERLYWSLISMRAALRFSAQN